MQVSVLHCYSLYLDDGDGESGIGKGEDFSDPMATPTALKSPQDPNAGLSTYYWLIIFTVRRKEVEEVGGAVY